MDNKEKLRFIPISLIEMNPENPRKIFDQEKLDELTESIKQRGEILVPINVFMNEKKKFVIIDGERRYRAALKLGIKEIPAILREHPKEEEYVTDMFHIHHMREPWELVPTALKLQEIINFLKKENKKEPSEEDLNKITKLSRAEIRRCKTVLGFHPSIQDLMLKEEARTASEKKEIGKDKLLSEDFFIEVDKNIIRPISKNKKLFNELGGKLEIFNLLIKKRRTGLIKNMVSLRPIAKYIKNYPKKSSPPMKKFILEDHYSLDSLLEDTGLEFDLYKFSRNLKVFSGAITNIPLDDLDSTSKQNISKNLREMRKLIENKLKELKE